MSIYVQGEDTSLFPGLPRDLKTRVLKHLRPEDGATLNVTGKAKQGSAACHPNMCVALQAELQAPKQCVSFDTDAVVDTVEYCKTSLHTLVTLAQKENGEQTLTVYEIEDGEPLFKLTLDKAFKSIRGFTPHNDMCAFLHEEGSLWKLALSREGVPTRVSPLGKIVEAFCFTRLNGDITYATARTGEGEFEVERTPTKTHIEGGVCNVMCYSNNDEYLICAVSENDAAVNDVILFFYSDEHTEEWDLDVNTTKVHSMKTSPRHHLVAVFTTSMNPNGPRNKIIMFSFENADVRPVRLGHKYHENALDYAFGGEENTRFIQVSFECVSIHLITFEGNAYTTTRMQILNNISARAINISWNYDTDQLLLYSKKLDPENVTIEACFEDGRFTNRINLFNANKNEEIYPIQRSAPFLKPLWSKLASKIAASTLTGGDITKAMCTPKPVAANVYLGDTEASLRLLRYWSEQVHLMVVMTPEPRWSLEKVIFDTAVEIEHQRHKKQYVVVTWPNEHDSVLASTAVGVWMNSFLPHRTAFGEKKSVRERVNTVLHDGAVAFGKSSWKMFEPEIGLGLEEIFEKSVRNRGGIDLVEEALRLATSNDGDVVYVQIDRLDSNALWSKANNDLTEELRSILIIANKDENKVAVLLSPYNTENTLTEGQKNFIAELFQNIPDNAIRIQIKEIIQDVHTFDSDDDEDEFEDEDYFDLNSFPTQVLRNLYDYVHSVFEGGNIPPLVVERGATMPEVMKKIIPKLLSYAYVGSDNDMSEAIQNGEFSIVVQEV